MTTKAMTATPITITVIPTATAIIPTTITISSRRIQQSRPSRPSRKKNDRDEEKRRPTFDPSNLEYEFKPIYTEEELAEIERQEEEERENDWINNDIDFDEYDKYYD